MTRATSRLDDNGGRCERCDDPATINKSQSTHEVMLGGGLGMGTMWLCEKCAAKRRERVSETPRGRVADRMECTCDESSDTECVFHGRIIVDEELLELVDHHQRRIHESIMLSPPSEGDDS